MLKCKNKDMESFKHSRKSTKKNTKIFCRPKISKEMAVILNVEQTRLNFIWKRFIEICDIK